MGVNGLSLNQGWTASYKAFDVQELQFTSDSKNELDCNVLLEKSNVQVEIRPFIYNVKVENSVAKGSPSPHWGTDNWTKHEGRA